MQPKVWQPQLISYRHRYYLSEKCALIKDGFLPQTMAWHGICNSDHKKKQILGQISRILFYLPGNNICCVPVEMVDKLFPGKSLWQLELSWSQSRVTWTSWDQQDTRLLLFNILMQSHFLSYISEYGLPRRCNLSFQFSINF